MLLVFSGISLPIAIFLATCSGQKIELKPAVFVGAEGSEWKINFTCTSSVDAAAIAILLNGAQPIQTEVKLRGVESMAVDRRTTVLSILPLAINNNTELRCQVVWADFSVEQSDISYLRIQGILDPPKGLKIAKSARHTHRLTWTAPFTLDLTGTDPDISSYRVCINSLKAKEHLDSNCEVTTNNYYDFPNSDLAVTIYVSAVNIGGVGRSSNYSHTANSGTYVPIVPLITSYLCMVLRNWCPVTGQ